VPLSRLARPLGSAFALLLMASACTSGSDDARAETDPDRITTTAEPERSLSLSGPDDGELLNAAQTEALSVEVAIDNADAGFDLDDLRVLLDGDDVTSSAEVGTDRLTWAPGELADGERTITIASAPEAAETADNDAAAGDDAVDGSDGEATEPAAPELEMLREWQVTIDTTPPEITLTSPDGAIVANQDVIVAGSTEPGATIQVGDLETTADAEGNFEVALDAPPQGALQLIATDEAGNETADEASFMVVPSRVVADEVRAVHVSFCAWATPSLRDPIIQQIEDGLITAVQLDIKDETGRIGPETQQELALASGADQADCNIDLPAAVEQLHELGVPVIGRIVAFADPMLARWAWDNGDRDMVIQTAGGELFTGKYAGFSNFANEDVAAYNIGVAEEAAAVGVDHILWDYLRKPDGQESQFDFVGLEGTPGEAIAEFTREADERLAPYGVQHGASLYGVSADRPTEVAQDVEVLADHLDYVAPMIYPSHWASGEYGVANPLMQPADMVLATLEVWNEATEDKRARVVPWLEDSNYPISLGYPDRTSYLSEQIRGTYERGINEWMLWDSSVRYTTAGMLQPSSD
jgi:hypothetical protein